MTSLTAALQINSVVLIRDKIIPFKSQQVTSSHALHSWKAIVQLWTFICIQINKHMLNTNASPHTQPHVCTWCLVMSRAQVHSLQMWRPTLLSIWEAINTNVAAIAANSSYKPYKDTTSTPAWGEGGGYSSGGTAKQTEHIYTATV